MCISMMKKIDLRKGAVMERLTDKTELGVSIDKNEDCPTCSICWNCDIPPRKCKYISDALKKLANYEDLEEQGRLIKLPCKVGDTVWDNDCGRPCAYTITAFSFGECEEYICEPVTTKEVVFYYTNSSGSITGSFAESEIGKSVFLNKSEAEAKLKELRGGENESSN